MSAVVARKGAHTKRVPPAVEQQPDPAVVSAALGGMLTNSGLACGRVTAAYGAPGLAHWRAIDAGNAADALGQTIEAVHGGDMSDLEGMLVAQAFALQTMFVDCATRARAQSSREASGTLMQAAMKAQAQAQCRATVQTIGELKNPRQVAFIRQQTNVATAGGQQQVNNATATPSALAHTPAREKDSGVRNELLLEEKNASPILEPRATRRASRSDSPMATVGVVNRAKNAPGKSRGIA